MNRIHRRTCLSAVAAIGATGLAGCIENIPFLGDGPISFAADPASVPEAVLEETGYEEHELEEVVIEETFEAGGQTQAVVVTNWQAEYDKSIDMGGLGVPIDEQVRAAVFTALSTPQVSVLGRTFNPIADMRSGELAEMVQDRYGGLENLEQVGEDTVTILGESTTVGEFEAEAELLDGGVAIDLTLHIAEAVESGDDLVVGVAGYPTDVREVERDNATTLLEAIEH